MPDKKTSRGNDARRVSRRAYIQATIGAGLLLGAGLWLGCAAPAQPTATVAKPAPTTAAAAPTTAVAAPTAAKPAAAAPTPVAEAPKKVVFATTTGQAGILTAVIKSKKIDLKYGLDLDLKVFDPADAERAVALKRVDVGVYAPISAATAANEGMPIALFAPMLWNNNYFTVFKDAPYQKITDLKGKKIATLTKISGSYTSAQMMFKALGMDFEKDFQVITGPPVATLALMERKEVDATIFADPWTLRLLVTGEFKELAAANDVWQEITKQPMFFIGLGAHRDWYNQNRPIAQSLLKAFTEGAKLIQAQPEVLDEHKDLIGLKTPQEVDMIRKRFPRFFATQWDDNAVKNAQLLIDRAAQLNIIPKVPAQSVFEMP